MPHRPWMLVIAINASFPGDKTLAWISAALSESTGAKTGTGSRPSGKVKLTALRSKVGVTRPHVRPAYQTAYWTNGPLRDAARSDKVTMWAAVCSWLCGGQRQTGRWHRRHLRCRSPSTNHHCPATARRTRSKDRARNCLQIYRQNPDLPQPISKMFIVNIGALSKACSAATVNLKRSHRHCLL